MDGLVSLGSLRRSHDIEYRHDSSLGRERERRPGSLVPGKIAVHSLDLPSRELFLHAQVQANEGESQGNWLGLGIRMLC